jgi:hypothetical protein
VSAASRGFGAVFQNAQQPGTALTFFHNSTVLDTLNVPTNATAGARIFAGAPFTQPTVTNVLLTPGQGVIFEFDGTTVRAGGANSATNDLVSVDDWAFAEPVPIANGFPLTSGPGGLGNAVSNSAPTATVPFPGVVATFADSDPDGNAKDFTAVINWGDGHPTDGRIRKNAQGGFDVTGTNTYAAGGTFPVSVDVADFGGGPGVGGSQPTLSINDTATAAAAPLTARGTTLAPFAGVGFTGTVATFPGADPPGNLAQYSATISFGDGTPATAGTITAGTGGAFIVSGSRRYVRGGTNAVTVTINDVGGALTTATTTAAVEVLRQTVGGYDPTTSTFFPRNENSQGAQDAGTSAFGSPGFFPVIGDWNGDGVQTIGVFDSTTGTWFLRNANSPGAPDAGRFPYGAPGIGLLPVIGDWTGIGHTGIGVFDPATGTWQVRNEISAGAPDAGTFKFGAPGVKPVTGAWQGVCHNGIGVFSQSTVTFSLRTEVSRGAADAGQLAFGNPNFLPLAGTYALPAHRLLAPGSGPTPAAAGLSNDQLHAAVAGALARLGAAGVDPSVLGSRATADHEVGTLPAGILGETNVPGRRVTRPGRRPFHARRRLRGRDGVRRLPHGAKGRLLVDARHAALLVVVQRVALYADGILGGGQSPRLPHRGTIRPQPRGRQPARPSVELSGVADGPARPPPEFRLLPTRLSGCQQDPPPFFPFCTAVAPASGLTWTARFRPAKSAFSTPSRTATALAPACPALPPTAGARSCAPVPGA